MKQERTKKKVNGLLVFSVGLLAVAIATPLTFALFSDVKKAQTDFTFGKIEIDKGKTTVNTNVASLLPGSAVFTDKVVVAKDLFSESYLLRAKHSFSTTGLTGADKTTYENALAGQSFQKKDGYGNLKYTTENWYSDADGTDAHKLYINIGTTDTPNYVEATTTNVAPTDRKSMPSDSKTGACATAPTDTAFFTKTTTEGTDSYTAFSGTAVRGTKDMANGFILVTQAVDADGKIYTSTYDATTSTYTLEAVDVDGTTGQDTVATGYAKNYRWFYHSDGYMYLCNYFADDSASTATLKNVERTNKDKTTDTINEQTFNNLDTEAGRQALITYFDETYTGTGDKSLKQLREAVTDAKTALEAKVTEYNTAVTATNNAKTTFTTNATAVTTAYNAVSTPNTATTAYYNNFVTYNNALKAYVENGTALSTEATNAKTALDTTTDVDSTVTTAVTTYLTSADNIKGLKDTELSALEGRASKITAVNTAITAYNAHRDAVAVLLKDYQELYVFALGGSDYNTIPTDLYQAANYAQYNATFQLSLEFNAVQSANVTFANDKTLATATPADIPTGLFD